MMVWLRTMLWLFLAAISMGAHANPKNDLIVERAIFVEPAPGALTIDQAVEQTYSPFGIVLNRGFAPTVRWIRLRLAAPQQGSERVILRVGPHYINEIQLFEKQEGAWTSRVAGDFFPVTQHACADNLYCFPVTIHAGVVNDLYLRIDSVNGFFLNTRAMYPDDLTELIVEQQRVFGLESGVVFAIGLWALFLFLRTGHRVVGIFCVSQVVTLLFGLSSSGLLAELFFKNHVWLDNLSFNTLYVFRLMVSLLLTYELLRSYGMPSWYNFYVKGVMAILLAELVAIVLGHVTLVALNFNFLLVSSMPYLLFFAVLGLPQMPVFQRRLICVGALIMGGLLWMDILPVLGWVRPDLVAAPGNWGGLIVALALSIIVGSDVSYRRKVFEQEMQELQVLRARNQIESEQIKERSMLIDMLTHELKNPLATMRMAAGSLRSSLGRLSTEQSVDSAERIDSMVQAMNNMNTVIERCVQVDQLDQKGFTINIEEFDVHEVVTALLCSQVGAERIDLEIESVPIIARTDPNLFAIILTNLLDNALKYSTLGSRINLSFKSLSRSNQSRPGLRVSVSNFVEARELPDPESVFNRYYRGPYAHERSGTGLGLYLVKSLCKILGGSISLDQQDGQVRFTVELK